MKPWLLLAIIGHLANAAAFIIDKTLLSTAFRRSASYAVMIGALSLLTLIAAPWIKTWPTQSAALILYGVAFPFALWSFFEALKRGEPSRVVPIVGSLIPLFTLLGTRWLMSERLSFLQLIGFALLLVSTCVLSAAPGKDNAKRFDANLVGFAMLSALLFALSSVAGKFAYGQGEFLGIFVTSRLWSVAAAAAILFLDVQAFRELRQVFFGTRQTGSTSSRSVMGLALVGQASGAVGFVLVNLALAQGSAAIVNALQAVQYAAIVLVGWFGSASLRRILQEPRRGDLLFLKGAAIFCLAVGLTLLSLGKV